MCFLEILKIFSSILFSPCIYLLNDLSCQGIGHLFFDNERTYTIMYMGSGEWLTADSLPPIQIEWYIVQPVNMAGKGIGNGDGRYVNYSSKN